MIHGRGLTQGLSHCKFLIKFSYIIFIIHSYKRKVNSIRRDYKGCMCVHMCGHVCMCTLVVRLFQSGNHLLCVGLYQLLKAVSQMCKRNFDTKSSHRGFPGGAVVESLPASAGDAGLSPGLGGSHMPRNVWAREPELLSLRIWSLCSATGGAMIVGGLCTAMRSVPRLPQLEKKPSRRSEDPTRPKINKLIN